MLCAEVVISAPRDALHIQQEMQLKNVGPAPLVVTKVEPADSANWTVTAPPMPRSLARLIWVYRGCWTLDIWVYRGLDIGYTGDWTLDIWVYRGLDIRHWVYRGLDTQLWT